MSTKKRPVKSATPVQNPSCQIPAFEPLEPRLLLSADVIGAEPLVPLQASFDQQSIVADASPIIGTLQPGPEQRVTAGGTDIQVAAYSVPVLTDWNADGLSDLVVGEKFDTGTGKVRVYLNGGSAGAPVYGAFFYVQAAGSDLTVPAGGCQGAYPRVHDWNQDGRKDLLIGLANGTIRLYLNIGTDANPAFGSSRTIQTGDPGAKVDLDVGDRAAFDIADWNGDGAVDLVVGALDGKVHVYLNRQATGEPDLASPITVQEGSSDLLVPSGRSSVAVHDFNGDGRKDLILGNTDAQVIFYPNAGTDAAPEFNSHEILLAIAGGSRSRPFVGDFNADGVPDVLVGNVDGLVRCFISSRGAADAEMIGYTTVFPNISEVVNRRAMPVVTGGAGSIQSISIYHQGGTGHAILAVYADAGGLPGARLGTTASMVISGTEGWQTIVLQNPVAVSASQKLWLAWVFENDPGMRWTEGLPGRAISSASWSGGMPESFGASTTTTGFYSIYANCTISETPTDVTPPGLVSGLKATPGDKQISLTWTNPSDADFAGVRVLRKTGSAPTSPMDGTLVYSGTGTSTVDAGLTNGTTYHYAAFTYDGVPNYSKAVSTSGTPQVSTTAPVGITTVLAKITTEPNRRAMPFVMSEAGTLASVSMYHQGGSGQMILAVYADNAGRPGNRLGVTASTAVKATAGWQTINLEVPVSVSSGQKIWLAWVFQSNPGIRYTSGTPGRADGGVAWSGGMPNAFGTSTISGYIYSIYANYTTTAQDVTPPGIVGNLKATPGDKQVSLSWVNPGDADFAGVRILRKTGSAPTGPTDGTVVYNGTANHYTNTGLTNGTTYYYAAFSYDEVPNYSSAVTASGTPLASGVNKTVGHTTVFPNISEVANRRAMPVTMGEAGVLASISIYHQGGTGRAILGVYSDAGGLPGAQLGTTASTLINGAEGWQTIALQSPVAVSSGQTIWLAWVFENDPGMRFTLATPGRASSTATWAGGMPSSFGPSTVSSGIYSIYANYTTAVQVPVEVIVDNQDAGTSSSGVWYPSSRTGAWGTDSMTTTGEGSTFTFTADLVPGTAYAVYAWWTSGPLRYTTVPHEIRSGGTVLDTVVVNQTLDGGQWNLLGVYTFAKTASVMLTADPNSIASVNADAVRFVPVAPESIEITGPATVNENSIANYTAVARYSGGLTSAIQPQAWSVNVPQATIDATGRLTVGSVAANTPAVISAQYTLHGVTVSDTHGISILNSGVVPVEVTVDNPGVAASSTGDWHVSGAPDPWGADSMVSWTPGSTYTFTADLVPGGMYAVYAWWTQSSCRYTAVPHEIRNGSTLLNTVNVDQTVNGGQWNLLGVFTFSGAASVRVLAAPSSSWSTNADAIRFAPVV